MPKSFFIIQAYAGASMPKSFELSSSIWWCIANREHIHVLGDGHEQGPPRRLPWDGRHVDLRSAMGWSADHPMADLLPTLPTGRPDLRSARPSHGRPEVDTPTIPRQTPRRALFVTVTKYMNMLLTQKILVQIHHNVLELNPKDFGADSLQCA